MRFRFTKRLMVDVFGICLLSLYYDAHAQDISRNYNFPQEVLYPSPNCYIAMGKL